jgi:23S rRNA U2552 (ribose-2'-O)-methylase RlmE/FtsJ
MSASSVADFSVVASDAAEKPPGVKQVDLRRSFDGVQATAHAVLGRIPVEGGLFVFLNKRPNQRETVAELRFMVMATAHF